MGDEPGLRGPHSDAPGRSDAGRERRRSSDQQLAGPGHVVVHGRDEGVDPVEADHPAQPLDERDLDLDAVELEVGRGPARRPRPGGPARRRRSGWCRPRSPRDSVSPVSQRAQPPGVHPVGGGGGAAVGRARWRSGSRARGRACRPRRPCRGRRTAGPAPRRHRRRRRWPGRCGRTSTTRPAGRRRARCPRRRSRAAPPPRAAWSRRRRPGCRSGSSRRPPRPRACRASTSTRWMNSSGVHDAISRSKGSTSTASTPAGAAAARRGPRCRSASAARGRGAAPPSGAGRRSPRPPRRRRARPRSPGPGVRRAGDRGGRRRSCRW